MRWAWLTTFGLCLVACEGGEIAIFSATQAGAAGVSGMPQAGADSDAGGVDTSGSGGISDAGGSAGSGGTSGACFNNRDCGADSFCSKASCMDAQGVCSPLAFPDDSSSAHVCGCDNVTYWNDSYRKYYGVASIMLMGICNQHSDGCLHDEDCPNHAINNALCAHLLPPNAPCGSPPGPGLCWVTPNPCPTTDTLRFQLCSPPGSSSGGQPQCATTCQAVQSRQPFVLLPPGQSCQ